MVNTTYAFHRFELKTGWISDFGSDHFSQFVLEKIKDLGIDTTFFKIHDHHLCALSVAFVDDDQVEVVVGQVLEQMQSMRPSGVEALIKREINLSSSGDLAGCDLDPRVAAAFFESLEGVVCLATEYNTISHEQYPLAAEVARLDQLPAYLESDEGFPRTRRQVE